MLSITHSSSIHVVANGEISFFFIAEQYSIVCVYIYIYIYTHTHTHTYIWTMENYLEIKKNENLPYVTMWMELEYIMLSKISQSEKDKYHMISLTCGI